MMHGRLALSSRTPAWRYWLLALDLIVATATAAGAGLALWTLLRQPRGDDATSD